jgi:very-long-chain enoyl-CoA reductase
LTLPVEGQAKPVVLADEKKTLADYGVTEGAKLRLKDLGPQVAYRWLYLWEYVSSPYWQKLKADK